MTLYEFVQLTQVEKVNLLFEGRFVTCKEDEQQTVVLYKLGDFFCEVQYDNANHSIIKMKPFRSKELALHFFAYQMN
jgi:hypothetical protein